MDKVAWKDSERLNAELKVMAKDIQGKIDSFVKDWAKFEEKALQVYKAMPKTDALFSDCPIAPKRLEMYMRANFAKLGWKWAAALMWGPESVRTFYEVVSDACTWGTRIMKDDENAEKKIAQSKLVEKETLTLNSLV